MTTTKHSAADRRQRKRDLEHHFAQDLTTLAYPLLVDLYLQEDDLARARKVCEIGLEHHPGHTPGLYLRAVIAVREGDLEEAEQWLEQALAGDSDHVEAAELLVALQERLKRGPYVLERAYQRLSRANPLSRSARSRLEQIRSDTELVRAVRRRMGQVEEELETVEEDTSEGTVSVSGKPPAAPPTAESAEPAESGQPTAEELEAETAWDLNIKKVAATLKDTINTLAAEAGEKGRARGAEPDQGPQDSAVPAIPEVEVPPLEVLEPAEEPAVEVPVTEVAELPEVILVPPAETPLVEVESPAAAGELVRPTEAETDRLEPEPEVEPPSQREVETEEPVAEAAEPVTEVGSAAEEADEALETTAPEIEPPTEPEAAPEQESGEEVSPVDAGDTHEEAFAEPEPETIGESIPAETEPEPEPEIIPPQAKAQLPHRTDEIEIDPQLATFTLATIYKVQGLYRQALQVLDLLAEKGADPDRIREETASIKDLMTRGNRRP